jgi:hypothetical protein
VDRIERFDGELKLSLLDQWIISDELENRYVVRSRFQYFGIIVPVIENARIESIATEIMPR